MSIALIAGAALKVAGDVFNGISQYNSSKYNSMLLNRTADQKLEEQKYNEELARRNYARLRGENEAAIGKSGLTADSFSDVMRDSDFEFERDILAQKYNAAREISAMRSQGRMLKKQGRNALLGSLLGAGASAASGYDKYNDLYGAKE